MDNFVLRVKSQELRRLYTVRQLYISIRRDWKKDSRLFFVEKAFEDVITGSGVFDRIIELDSMSEQERRFCLQNNWYGKIFFDRVERFLPPVPVRDTSLVKTRSALLHGLAVTESQALEIDKLVTSRIIS